MKIEAEIKAKYKKLHDELTESFYNGTSGLTKEEFNAQHGQIWADMEAELIAEGYRALPGPSPDELRLAEIVATSPEAITMPEMWEAIRILARLRGIEEV